MDKKFFGDLARRKWLTKNYRQSGQCNIFSDVPQPALFSAYLYQLGSKSLTSAILKCLHKDGCNILKIVCIMPPATFLQQPITKIAKITQRVHFLMKVKTYSEFSLTVVKIYNRNANIWIVTLKWTLIRLSVFLTSRDGNSERFSTLLLYKLFKWLVWNFNPWKMVLIVRSKVTVDGLWVAKWKVFRW